jgi:hypothetical protein
LCYLTAGGASDERRTGQLEGEYMGNRDRGNRASGKTKTAADEKGQRPMYNPETCPYSQLIRVWKCAKVAHPKAKLLRRHCQDLHRDRRPSPRSYANRSHVWDELSVSSQGCTSKLTPKWDDLGWHGIPGEGGGVRACFRSIGRL